MKQKHAINVIRLLGDLSLAKTNSLLYKTNSSLNENSYILEMYFSNIKSNSCLLCADCLNNIELGGGGGGIDITVEDKSK